MPLPKTLCFTIIYNSLLTNTKYTGLIVVGKYPQLDEIKYIKVRT